MSKFYKSISDNYEKIFPLNVTMGKFLLESSPGKEVLDIGCGTGLMAQYLTDHGMNPICIDLEKSMVRQARQKGLNAMVMDMLEFDFDKKFDMIYCVGNTLSHLDSFDEVRHFLEKVYVALEDQGVFVVQVINFIPFLEKDGSYLGQLDTIENGISFEREYYRSGKYIRFHTVLKDGKDRIENDQLLIPVTYDFLIEEMEKLGFKLEVYGGFDKRDFDKDIKGPLVIRASK